MLGYFSTIVLIILSSMLSLSYGRMYDVAMPNLRPVKCDKCVKWSETTNATSYFADSKNIKSFENFCAHLGNSPGMFQFAVDPNASLPGVTSAFCMCDADTWSPCESKVNQMIPEQINIQLASPDTVVVSFVTFSVPSNFSSPIAIISDQQQQKKKNISGVTHTYVSPSGNRTYYMHFVVLSELEAKKKYTVQVSASPKSSPFSDSFEFKAPHGGLGMTQVAIFGDMGSFTWNNMGNMLNDVENDRIDAILHIGDHCYNLGEGDERRGDAYMQQYEPLLTRVPWVPIIGNHEFYDGDELRRYLNQTDGVVVAQGKQQQKHTSSLQKTHGGVSTATSALGSLLSLSSFHSGGLHSGVPSNTSRFFSVDLGLIHFVALDLNIYNGVDNCGKDCRQAQLKWLTEDLSSIDRSVTPWIVAMAHFPLYCSNCPAPGTEPGVWWDSEYCEYVGHDKECVVPNEFVEKTMRGANGLTNSMVVPDFEPIFMKFGVDVFASGHVHDYEWTYPIYNNSKVGTDFKNPKAPVHLVTGNGGPPSASKFGNISEWSYLHSKEDISNEPDKLGSYTIMTAFNSTTMKWTQIANGDGRVLDELEITQDSHGPFSPPVSQL